MCKDKIVVVDFPEHAVDRVLPSLNACLNLLDEVPSSDYRLYTYRHAFFAGMLDVLGLLGIKPVFDGDSFIGLIPSVEDKT